ncbi:SRCR-like domain-containing protein, partial [Baffinella frigidus]
MSDCAGGCCRIEIFYNDQWGTICDDEVTERVAQVVCIQLGFTSQGAEIRTVGGGGGPIWLDGVICSGAESTIGRCQHNPWGNHNCGHDEDVGVCCVG